MKTGRDLFVEFVERKGGRGEAAKALGCSLALIDHIFARRRSITKTIAEKVESASGGEFRKEHLLWGKATTQRPTRRKWNAA